jgi:hypothetical protein
LRYGKAGFLNPGFVATSGWRPPSADELLVADER